MFITLLSDLGNNDPGVAKIKSILLQEMPQAHIIDITHNIQPFYLHQAGYLLSSATGNFPQGTYHIAIYNIYDSRQPTLVLAKVGAEYIIAPDNGIIPCAFADSVEQVWELYQLNQTDNLTSCIRVIADTIAKIGNSTPEQHGLKQYELKNIPALNQPRIYSDYIECFVLHIDRFENVILNVRKDQFEKAANGRKFTIQFMRGEKITSISNNYNAVDAGDKLCRFNSADYLEIAVNNGNAAGLFGFRLVHERQQFFDIIKIEFE